MSRKKGWKFFWCSKIQFKHIFETQNEPFLNEILISEKFEKIRVLVTLYIDVLSLFWVTFG